MANIGDNSGLTDDQGQDGFSLEVRICVYYSNFPKPISIKKRDGFLIQSKTLVEQVKVKLF